MRERDISRNARRRNGEKRMKQSRALKIFPGDNFHTHIYPTTTTPPPSLHKNTFLCYILS